MKGRYFLLWLTLSALILLSGCSRITQGNDVYFAYRSTPFRAEIRGSLDGIAFSAEIGRETADAPLYIRYLSPQAMQGILLYRNGDGKLFVEMDSLSYPLDDSMADGWLRPLKLLFEGTEILNVQKENGSIRLNLPQGELRLMQEGYPLALAGDGITLETVWWERAAK
ncbi:MAG: hypothetical protein IJX80_00390 [Clostridia bacterium]|nr:hypothetical protein [Clostridia bacterium]